MMRLISVVHAGAAFLVVITLYHFFHLLLLASSFTIAQYPLHQFPPSKSATSRRLPVTARNKPVTSWCGQKSVVSVASCRFPNSITTTCCRQRGHVCNGFRTHRCTAILIAVQRFNFQSTLFYEST